MRRRILGAIGVLWGGTLLVLHFIRGVRSGGMGAYAAGRELALLFAAALFLLGLYYLVRPASSKR
jgi:hypothetical protein